MKLLIDWHLSPVGLILEGAEGFHLSLIGQYVLDSRRTEGADEFIFEIPHAHEESECLHMGDRKIGAKSDTLQGVAELVRFSFVAQTCQFRVRWGRHQYVLYGRGQQRGTTHRDNGNTLRSEVPSEATRQRFNGSPIAITFDEYHGPHVNQGTGQMRFACITESIALHNRYDAHMPSFDIVSQVDIQEVRNAVDQSMREVTTRYDFKGTDSSIRLSDDGITVESESDGRLEAAIDVLKGKLVRRNVSLKSIAGGEPKQIGGGRYRAEFTLNEGIAQDAAKELVKDIKDMKLKVQVAIQGDQIRVSGKKRDDLQEVIAAIKGLDFRLPLQYINFRD